MTSPAAVNSLKEDLHIKDPGQEQLAMSNSFGDDQSASSNSPGALQRSSSIGKEDKDKARAQEELSKVEKAQANLDERKAKVAATLTGEPPLPKARAKSTAASSTSTPGAASSSTTTTTCPRTTMTTTTATAATARPTTATAATTVTERMRERWGAARRARDLREVRR